jgi:outer membrane protein TolC
VESRWKALQGELAVLLIDDRIYDLTPEFDLYRRVEMLPLSEEVKKLKVSSRAISSLNTGIERRNLSTKAFRESEKPDLSLVTSLNLKEADDDFGNSLGTDRPDLSIGLNFRYPLGNRAARAEVRRSKLQIVQLTREKEEVEISLVSNLTSLYIQIVELVKVLDLNREQIASAQERTVEELRLYNQGRVELTFVIQSRDNEENAKLTYAENALTYQKLLVRYRALMDELLPVGGK